MPLKSNGNIGNGPHERRAWLARKDEERRKREAAALEAVKAIRIRPEPPKPRQLLLPHTELPGTNPNAPGVVYFVYCAGRIKIGYTANVKRRMIHLATHSPAPAVLLLTIRGSKLDEAGYHEMFAADRVHMEWFRLSYDLREFLSSQFDFRTPLLLFEAEIDYLDMVRDGSAYIEEIAALI